MLRKTLLALLVSVLYIGFANADNLPNLKHALERAISLVEHERYSEARHSLTILRQNISIDDEPMVRYVDFLLARCAAELRDNDAENILIAFMRRYPESVHVNEVRFMLAMHYCEKEEYDKARDYFKKVSYVTLDDRDRERYNMRMGYIEFISGNHKEAYRLFSKLSPTGEYADHAVYYKSYIHYHNGDYNKAYDGFKSLEKSDNYAKIVPYYLFQIRFSSGDYRYVVENGDKLLRQAVAKERTSLMRVVAEAWYRLQDFNNAFTYMSMYKKSGGNMGREENYILGYSAYRSTNYSVAIDALRKVAAEGENKGMKGDNLSQNASYHLADCYIRINDKQQAIHAFAMAADEKFNNEISEDALFNYGKLLFETGGGTFNESINVLTRYITKYPNSERVYEARELLIAAYYNSHDYEMAYNAIKLLPNPDADLRAALQKISYFNGLTAFQAGDYEKARVALEESRSIKVSPKYTALCSFWLGEMAYKQGNYKQAIAHYDTYVRNAPKNEKEYRMALYNLGYAHFISGNTTQSQEKFKGFVWLYKQADRYRADALNRLGDTYYLQRKYDDAVKSYQNAMSLGTPEQDYAKYQRAISLGLSGKTSTKIEALRQMRSQDCGDYNDDAAYELGRTYVSLGRYSEGASVLEAFVKEYVQSQYYTQALLDLGLIYINLGNNDKSLTYYDKVISNAPQSPEARSAIRSVREIYVSKGDVNAYFDYAKRVGVECDTSLIARDSLSFRAAQNVYAGNRMADAITRLEEYLKEFPKGYYTTDALFYLCDCYIKSDSLDGAVRSLKLLAEQPQGQYTHYAVSQLSRMTFENKMYEESAKAYRRLYELASDSVERNESANRYAESVLLRNDDEALLAMANDLDTLADVGATMKRRVTFAKAKVYASRSESAEALKIYESLAVDVSNIEGAESTYRIIEALFAEGKYDESEKKVYEFANAKTPYSYWLAKSFIILGDIYVARNDIFQARATYLSVVDGYTPNDDGVVAEAQSKLEKLN